MPHPVDLLIQTPHTVCRSVSTGALDGRRAFAQGAYAAKGNLGLLMRLGRIFKGGRAAIGQNLGEATRELKKPNRDTAAG